MVHPAVMLSDVLIQTARILSRKSDKRALYPEMKRKVHRSEDALILVLLKKEKKCDSCI